MTNQRNILRDTFVLSLPAVALVIVHAVSAATSFYNAEVVGYHGHPLGSERVGGLERMLRHNERTLFSRIPRRYLPDPLPENLPIRIFDLRIEGLELEKLQAALPISAKTWRPAKLVEGGKFSPVEVRYRGQLMRNYFFDVKAWKIKTKKRGLVDNFRTISLTPAEGRLEGHISLLIGREAGLPVPRCRLVRLFVNKEDQGLYFQEEQIDESMIRHTGRMPGDIFYGEIVPPKEPKLSSDDLFWNPFLWEKHDRFGLYSEEYRPYLSELIDHINDDSPESFDRLYRLLDMDEFPLYLAVLAFQGDQHIDDCHNHRLYFSPLTGRFEAILWNPAFLMPRGEGVESMLNRFFLKLARDPRFLDSVHKNLFEKLYRGNATTLELNELDRLQSFATLALDQTRFENSILNVKDKVAARAETIEKLLQHGEISFSMKLTDQGATLTVFAEAVASFQLRELVLAGPTNAVRLYEDRDGDGQVGPADRELEVAASRNGLRVLTSDANLYTGRDFRAPYHKMVNRYGAGSEVFSVNLEYTRLAALESNFLLVAEDGAAIPEVVSLVVSRTVGDWPVNICQGPPRGAVAVDTVHPWSFPKPPKHKSHRFSGVVELTEDLIVGQRDLFEIAAGTEFRLGAGVSIVSHAKARFEKVKIRRLNPELPWGVVAIQGKIASGSEFVDCDISGGSEDTLGYVYYSGMLSVYEADRVTGRDSVFSNNVFGDDTIRFARCRDVRVEGVKVNGANGDGIDCDICSGTISDTVVRNSRNDGIDLMTSKVDLQRVVIIHAGDKGISFGEGAHPVLTDCQITNCIIGLGIKDTSNPVVRNTHIEDCRIGISSYDKNWRYPGGGRGRLIDCTLARNDLELSLCPLSRLTLERCVTEDKYELPAAGATNHVIEIDPKGPRSEP